MKKMHRTRAILTRSDTNGGTAGMGEGRDALFFKIRLLDKVGSD
jgi:hypothetical protein